MKAFFIILKSGISMVVYSGIDLLLRPPMEKGWHFDIVWDEVSMIVESTQNTKNETDFTKEHQNVIGHNTIAKQESSMHTKKMWEKDHPPVVQLAGQGPGAQF